MTTIHIQSPSLQTKTIIALFAIMSLLFLTACDKHQVVETLELDHEDVFSVTVGTCFDDDTGYEDEVDSVPVRKCSEPHDNEIYYSYQLTGDVYPESEEADQAMFDRCDKEFQKFIGIPYDESIYDYDLLSPSDLSWEDGDREVLCYAYDGELNPVTGSLAGIKQ